MTLKLASFILEDVHFGHNGDFLSKAPTPFAEPHVVELEVQLIKGADPRGMVVRLRAKSEDPATQYSFRASYLVLMQVEDETAEDLDKRIGITGATMVMPHLRELIGNVTGRGRFGPCWLAPTNFSDIVPPPKLKSVRRVRTKKK